MARIDVERLTVSFGATTGVDGLTFTVPGGQFFGLLGHEGAGKTTTLRCLLGLRTPTAGTATIDGRRYRDLADPARTVGAVLQPAGFHPARTPRQQLTVVCTAGRLPVGRVTECLELVALAESADERIGRLPQGARGRLALATALLGDPGILVLDEPAAHFDGAARHWLGDFLRRFVDGGGTALVANRALTEVERSADAVVVVAGGQLVKQVPLAGRSESADAAIRVRTVQPDQLAAALTDAGAAVERLGADTLRVRGATTDDVGVVARAADVAIRELATDDGGVEVAVRELLGDRPLEELREQAR